MNLEGRRPFDVLVHCTAVHGDHRHEVFLAYDKLHPAAMEIVFVPQFESWVFARDLLFTAAVQGAPAGEGDIDFQPDYSEKSGACVLVRMRSHDEEDTFVLDRRTVQKFLYETMDLVPLGEEDYSGQVDDFLNLLRIKGEGR